MSQQNHPETAAQKLSMADADAIKAALVDCAARQMERGIYSPSELREVEDELVAAFLRINSWAFVVSGDRMPDACCQPVSAAPEAMTPAQLDQLADALWPLLGQRVLDKVQRGVLSTPAAESRSSDMRGQR